MGSLRFELTVYGGVADEAKAAADAVGVVLREMTRDVQAVCRNLSPEEDLAGLAERLEACRLYVVGVPFQGNSLTLPMETGLDTEAWAEVSLRAYASGLAEIRDSPPTVEKALPRGFDAEILRRVSSYSKEIAKEHGGLVIAIPDNGVPPIRATVDRKLEAAVNIKLAVINMEQATLAVDKPLDHKIHGYSIQGVLYELSDPEYLDPHGQLIVEIDTRDGHHWVCKVPREAEPPNLRDLWRTEVMVTGSVTPRLFKPIMEAEEIVPLASLDDPVESLRELVALFSGPAPAEDVQAFMDRVRERD